MFAALEARLASHSLALRLVKEAQAAIDKILQSQGTSFNILAAKHLAAGQIQPIIDALFVAAEAALANTPYGAIEVQGLKLVNQLVDQYLAQQAGS